MGTDVLADDIQRYAMEISVTRLYRWKLRVNQAQATVSVATVGDVFRDIGAWSLVKFAENTMPRCSTTRISICG